MPSKLKMPPRIPDTPENIALACMQGPPKKKWDYLEKAKQEGDSSPEEGDGSVG